jgi:hypothetical protein
VTPEDEAPVLAGLVVGGVVVAPDPLPAVLVSEAGVVTIAGPPAQLRDESAWYAERTSVAAAHPEVRQLRKDVSES